MKRRQFLVAAPLLVAGCASWLKPGPEGEAPNLSPAITTYLVESAGMALGSLVVQMPPEIDTALRNVYTLATEGKFDTESINNLINTLISSDDLIAKLMVNRLIGAVEMLGAEVLGGQIISLEELDPVLLQALADGYVTGYELGKREVKRRSAA